MENHGNFTCWQRYVPRVNILREANLGRATHIDQSRAAVQRIAADADAGAPSITVDLHHAVKQLLRGTRPLLDPRLLVRDAKELGALHNGNLVVVEVLDNQLVEEVGPGAKVGVENGKVVAVGARKGPTQVARLLEAGAVVAHQVVEAVALGELLDRLLGAVVEDVHAQSVGRPVELRDVLPGVVKDLELLGADGQVDVDGGRCRALGEKGVEARDAGLVGVVVPVLAHDADPVADEQVQVEEPDKDAVPVEVGRAEREEPHTRRQGQEGEDAKDVERDAVRVHVRELLGVGGTGGQHQGGLLDGAVGLAYPVVAALERVARLARLAVAIVGLLLVLGGYGAAGRAGLGVRVQGVEGLFIDGAQVIVV